MNLFRSMFHTLFITAVASTFFSTTAMAQAKEVYPQYEGVNTLIYFTVTPVPQEETYDSHFYQVQSIAAIGEKDIVAQWAKICQDRFKIKAMQNPNDGGKSADMVVRLGIRLDGVTTPDKKEGYRLEVRKDGDQLLATLSGSDDAGLRFSLQSLRQLMLPWKNGVVVRPAVLNDWPAIRHRMVKRYTTYWLDQAVSYKLNGGVQQLMLDQINPASDRMKKAMDSAVKNVHDHHMAFLGMVNMGYMYRGKESDIQAAVDTFLGLHKQGYDFISIHNDDRLTLADGDARERFGGYYETQKVYLDRITSSLKAAGYNNSVGFMPNHYYGQDVNETELEYYRGKLPNNVAWYWAGDWIPGLTAFKEDHAHIAAQIQAPRYWYYTNWPQMNNQYFAPNFGASRHHSFDPKVVELVAISTDIAPRAFPTSFITMADHLWNPEQYNPDRSLKRAIKEVVSPASYDAYYALFTYLESLAPYPTRENAIPSLAADTPELQEQIIRKRHQILNPLVEACLKTPEAQDPRAQRVLLRLTDRMQDDLNRLAKANASQDDKTSRRSLVCPTITTAPKLDGSLDDEVWKQAAVADTFTLVKDKTKLAPQQTVVKLMRDKEWLYIGIRAEEPFVKDPSFIQAGLKSPIAFKKAPDAFLWWAEEIELFFDPGQDQKDIVQILVNPWAMHECFIYDLPRKGYWGIANQHRSNLDIKGATRITDDGWQIEFAVPLSFIGSTDSPWGFNVARTRKITLGGEMKYTTWNPIGWGFQDANHFGQLNFSDKK